MIKIITDGSRVLPYQSFVFSGGEVSVKISEPPFGFKTVNLVAHIDSSEELIKLLMIKDALGRFGYTGVVYKLTLPYLPYARQDRVCADGEALSIRVVANIINSMGFDKVKLYDCHSDVGVALINNCYNVEQGEIFEYFFTTMKDTGGLANAVLVSPDAGANKKVNKLGKLFDVPVIRADKERDVNTGAITGTVVYGDCAGKTAIICDDICDGGYTFVKLAEALNAKGVRSIALVVTHGIFSKGVDVLYEAGINVIFTTDSICTLEPSESLEIVSVN